MKLVGSLVNVDGTVEPHTVPFSLNFVEGSGVNSKQVWLSLHDILRIISYQSLGTWNLGALSVAFYRHRFLNPACIRTIFSELIVQEF